MRIDNRMKLLKQTARLSYPLLLATLFCAGCANIPKTTVAVDRISQPPPGKALVNIHRPSGWGGGRAFPIFDASGKMLVDLTGGALYQKVCDPGEQVFIGFAEHVSVVKCDLAPDKIYDIIADISLGWVQANIFLSPVTKTSARRAKLADFERREKQTLSINPASPRVAEYEARRQNDITQVKADFLGGPKADRTQLLQKDDCR
jgi:hypothetical protein